MLIQEEPASLVISLNRHPGTSRCGSGKGGFRLTIRGVEADGSNGQPRPPKVDALELLQPHLLPTPMARFPGRGRLHHVELGIELILVDVLIPQPAQRCLGVRLPPLRHQPARALGEEEEGDALDRGREEEDGEWDLVGLFARQSARAVVDRGADDGADGQLRLVDAKDDAAEVRGGDLTDVDLGKGEEPAD